MCSPAATIISPPHPSSCTLAAAVPARMPREALIALLDAVPGTAGVKAAAELLSSPLPPVAQPNNNSPVEVKLLAAQVG